MIICCLQNDCRDNWLPHLLKSSRRESELWHDGVRNETFSTLGVEIMAIIFPGNLSRTSLKCHICPRWPLGRWPGKEGQPEFSIQVRDVHHFIPHPDVPLGNICPLLFVLREFDMPFLIGPLRLFRFMDHKLCCVSRQRLMMSSEVVGRLLKRNSTNMFF